MQSDTSKGRRGYFLLIVGKIETEDGIFEAETILAERLAKRAWPLNLNTRNVHRIKQGDGVAFYVANRGKTRSYIAGTGRVAWDPRRPSAGERGRLAIEADQFLGAEFFIGLEDVRHFAEPISAARMLEGLELFADVGKFWGTRLQGGAKTLLPADYEWIVTSGK